MGLWNGIVRRGITGEERKEDDYWFLCEMYGNHRQAGFIGIFTISSEHPNVINGYCTIDKINHTSTYTARCSNAGEIWHIRKISPEDKKLWVKEFGHLIEVVRDCVKNGFYEDETILMEL